MDIFLTQMLKESWKSIQNGSSQPGSPFKNMVISSYGQGTISTVTVVLRAVNIQNNIIIFYTDIRSAKVENLIKNNNISILFYDDKEKFQLVLKGSAIINNQSDITAEHWATLSGNGKRSYMAQPGPSTKINLSADGLGYINDNTIDDALKAGYKNFALVSVKVNFIDWLKLKHAGHQRACFNFTNNNEWEGSWLIP